MKALCPTRAKIEAAMAEKGRVSVEWKPTESGRMRADIAPYGTGKMVTWSVAVAMTKDGRPATGRDGAATILISVALDQSGRWSAKLAPGQEEGERPMILDGADGGYPAAQSAVADVISEYARKTIGKRRGLIPVALRSPQGGGDVVTL